jgi:hypothetical protein
VWSKNNCAHIPQTIKPPHRSMAYLTCGMYVERPHSSNRVTLFHFCNTETKNDMVFVE